MPQKNAGNLVARSAASMVEDVVGCKWTVRILASVRAGTHRPGALLVAHPGLTTKVLNERLRKLLRFGVINRKAYAETPPRVEYRLTPLGRRFVRLLDQIEDLQAELDKRSSEGG